MGDHVSSTDKNIDESGLNLECDKVKDRNITASEFMTKVKNLDSNDPNYVLIARDIDKTYRNKKDCKALDDFCLAVEKGQIFGLLGPNGAGKTTFLKILTGTENLDKGEAFIGGIDITDRHGDNIKMGFCPQFDILWPMLTVTEHITFF